MKQALSLLCALLLLLAGCAATPQETEGAASMAVWRVYTGGGSEQLLQAEDCVLPDGARADTEQALAFFVEPSARSDLRAALPDGVELLGWTTENGAVTLSFSDGFLALSDMDRTLTAFCATLTLCELEDVYAVTVCAGGETLFQGLVPEDALLQDTDSDPYTRRLRLYFPDGQGLYLVSEYHSLSLDEDSSLDRYVVEELLRGPNDPALGSAVPKGTELLSCSTEDGVCTVDLSAAFVENKPASAVGERLTIYSLVDSLTVLSDVDSVRILCEGEPIETYLYRPLNEPLESYLGALGPASAAKDEIDAALYLALPGLAAVAPLPFVVERGEQESAEEAVLRALTDSAEPGYPQLFFGSGTIVSLAVDGRACTVDVTESFFASLSETERAAAVGSVAATLCNTDEIRSVRFTVGGEDAVFEGVSYAGPWSRANIVMAE